MFVSSGHRPRIVWASPSIGWRSFKNLASCRIDRERLLRKAQVPHMHISAHHASLQGGKRSSRFILHPRHPVRERRMDINAKSTHRKTHAVWFDCDVCEAKKTFFIPMCIRLRRHITIKQCENKPHSYTRERPSFACTLFGSKNKSICIISTCHNNWSGSCLCNFHNNLRRIMFLTTPSHCDRSQIINLLPFCQ